MEDVKDKMKNLFKKANNPFSSSSSSSSAFKGQSHILGSSPSPSFTPSNSSSSHLIKKSASAAGSIESPANCVGRFLSGQPAEESVEIAIKLLRNVAQEPGNEKFRRIRMGNLRVKEAIGEAEGGVELLECAGFRFEEGEGGERWGRMGELTRERIDVIWELVLLLERSKGKDDGDGVGNGGVGKLDEGKEREVKIIDRKVV